MNKYLHMVVIYLGLVASVDADWLQENLTEVSNGSGTFSTSQGTTHSGGSYSLKIPHSTYQLYSIDPPSISAGCNGIDIHLGGISFISKEEALEMLRAIAQGTLTMTFLMAFKQACPVCATALEKVQEWMARMNINGINTCQMSTALAGAIVGESEDAKNGACGTIDAENNGTASFLSSYSSRDSDCKASAGEVMKKLNEEYCDQSKNKCEDLGLSEIIGVSTFEYLTKMNILSTDTDPKDMAIMELMLSLYGTFDNGSQLNATLDTEDVSNLIKCGAKAGGDMNTNFGDKIYLTVVANCSSWWGVAQGKTVITCVEGEKGTWQPDYPCTSTEPKDLADWVSDNSIALQKIGIVQGGYIRAFVRSLETVTVKVKNKSEDPLTAIEVKMIGAAPFPLYRLINLTAYFDESLIGQVLGDTVITIAEDMAIEVAKNTSSKIAMVNTAMGHADEGQSEMIPLNVSKMIREGRENNRNVAADVTVSKEAQARMYDLITSNIVSLEKAVMREQSANLVMTAKGK